MKFILCAFVVLVGCTGSAANAAGDTLRISNDVLHVVCPLSGCTYASSGGEEDARDLVCTTRAPIHCERASR